ncbi:MAG: TSUP family transporter [Pseudobdellovibrionaceae bacterium]
MTFLIPILIGAAAGIASGLFGIGGGIIIIPLLLFTYKFSQQVSTATSLIALLLPVGSLGLWQYYRSGFVTNENIKIGFLIALGMIVGTFYGAKIATFLEADTLTKMFAVFLLLVAIRVWFSN